MQNASRNATENEGLDGRESALRCPDAAARRPYQPMRALNAFLDARSNLCYTDDNVEQDYHFDSDGHRAGYSTGKSYRAIVHPLQRASTTSVQAGLLR